MFDNWYIKSPAFSRLGSNRVGDPSNLVVVTATGYGYRREDGVQVVPLTALGP